MRENNPGMGMKAWMEELGRGFREVQKGRNEEVEKEEVEGIVLWEKMNKAEERV